MRWFSFLLAFLAFPVLGFDEKTALTESQAAIGRRLGDYRFTDSDGRPVRLADLRGKPLVVSFVYTGCFQVCPATTQFLGKAVSEAERRSVTAEIGKTLPRAVKLVEVQNGRVPVHVLLGLGAAERDALRARKVI